jgi:hypothetical protein
MTAANIERIYLDFTTRQATITNCVGHCVCGNEVNTDFIDEPLFISGCMCTKCGRTYRIEKERHDGVLFAVVTDHILKEEVDLQDSVREALQEHLDAGAHDITVHIIIRSSTDWEINDSSDAPDPKEEIS